MRLGLPVFHITEEPIKDLVPAEVYEAQVGLADLALDTAAIGDAVRQVRARLPAIG